MVEASLEMSPGIPFDQQFPGPCNMQIGKLHDFGQCLSPSAPVSPNLLYKSALRQSQSCPVDRSDPRTYGPAGNFTGRATGALVFVGPALIGLPANENRQRFGTMKVRNSLKSLRGRDRNNQLVRRKGRLYVINKRNPRFKARQG